MSGFDNSQLSAMVAELRVALDSAEPADIERPFDERPAPFDLFDFDCRLAALLGIETPIEYANRKAAEEGPGHPVKLPDEYSVGRKLVAMLGEGWTWSASNESGEGIAWVSSGDDRFEAQGPMPIALRLVALEALVSR